MDKAEASGTGAGAVDEAKDLTVDHSIIKGRRIHVRPTKMQFEMLKRRLEERIRSSRGETIYEIGFGEHGGKSGLSPADYRASVATLKSLATAVDSDILLLYQRICKKGLKGQYLVRKRVDETDFMEVRVAILGNVDSGKTTLLEVLTHAELDNGLGIARTSLLIHKHEIETGRTSSVSNDILGFDNFGNVVNKTEENGTLDWAAICKKSSKVITFFDMAGHEKYIKTAIFGVNAHAPDYGILTVAANAGIIGTTKEHLGLLLALSLPMFVVITKIDVCPPDVLNTNLKILYTILKSQGIRKIPFMITSIDEVVLCAKYFTSDRLCPIFKVSNVTGENLELLKTFLNLLSTGMTGNEDQPAEFQIIDVYSVPDVGTVVSGTCLQGVIKLNDVLLLGPDSLKQFISISIESIYRNRLRVEEVRAGQTASFALTKTKRNQIRKGMVIVSPKLKPKACWEFESQILVLHHPTTISLKYHAMVHCGTIAQTAKIVWMSKDHLRTGDRARVRFRFFKYPEYMKPGQVVVVRDGRTKAVGNVVLPVTNPSLIPFNQEHKQNLKLNNNQRDDEANATGDPKPPKCEPSASSSNKKQSKNPRTTKT